MSRIVEELEEIDKKTKFEQKSFITRLRQIH